LSHTEYSLNKSKTAAS